MTAALSPRSASRSSFTSWNASSPASPVAEYRSFHRSANINLVELALRRRAAEDGYQLRGLLPDRDQWLALVGPLVSRIGLTDEPSISNDLRDRCYRRLLRDGAVIIPDVRWRSKVWVSCLWLRINELAERDGLCCQPGFAYWDEYDFFGAVILLRRSGAGYPHDTAFTGEMNAGTGKPTMRPSDRLRPLVEEDWGETLEAARRRAGVER